VGLVVGLKPSNYEDKRLFVGFGLKESVARAENRRFRCLIR
jgi:hypothetical protein